MNTEFDPAIFDIRRTIDDMRFINYRIARLAGASAERLARVFPQAESFERMYQDELRSSPPPEAA